MSEEQRKSQDYEAMLRGALGRDEVGMVVLDPSFHVVWANEAVERYLGLRPEDVAGRNTRELVRHVQNIFENPRYYAQSVLATYENNTFVASIDCHTKAREGQPSRWLRHWSCPITEGPHAGGRIELIMDITDKKTNVEKDTGPTDPTSIN